MPGTARAVRWSRTYTFSTNAPGKAGGSGRNKRKNVSSKLARREAATVREYFRKCVLAAGRYLAARELVSGRAVPALSELEKRNRCSSAAARAESSVVCWVQARIWASPVRWTIQ